MIDCLMGFALGFELRAQDWGPCKDRRWGPRSYGLRIYLGRWMYYREFGHPRA